MAVKDIDHGWINIKRKLKSADRSFTKVGLPFNTNVKSGSRKGSGRKTAISSNELITIAMANEFGTKSGRIPSRPALRQAFDMHQAEITRVTGRIYGKVLDRTISVKKGLGLLGEFVAAKMKRQITLLKTPANEPSTIKAKGSSNPLIDTGQYRASITHIEVIR